MALSVVLLGLTGCGGDSGSAPPPEAAAPAPAGQAGGGGAVPVSDSGGGSAEGAGIANDIETERVAAKRAVSEWGRAAEKACRKAERRMEPWLQRVLALKPPKGKRLSRAEVRKIGRSISEYGRSAEYHYELLQKVAMPREAAAVDTVEDFFDKEEEALMLVQRLGVELESLRDLEGFLTTLKRLDRLSDDYERAGRAAGASRCVDDD